MSLDRSVRVHPHRDRARLTPWGLLLIGLATAVIAGILSMHGFSVGHQTPVATSTTSGVVTADHGSHAAPADADHGSGPMDCCETPGAMAMMCVFILLTLVLLQRRSGGPTWRWRPTWLSAPTCHPPSSPGHLSRVSLIRLCISRT